MTRDDQILAASQALLAASKAAEAALVALEAARQNVLLREKERQEALSLVTAWERQLRDIVTGEGQELGICSRLRNI